MLSAEKDQSALGRGTTQASASSNSYRTVLPRLPTGKLVANSVFLHADLAGRPYRAQDFRDTLRNAIDLKEISSIGQFQMSHVWMVTCKTSVAKTTLVNYGELLVKNRRCMVIDPEPKAVKMKLLWLPEHLEDGYIREALQLYGKVTSIKLENWRVADMEDMRTLNRDVMLSLNDGVSVSEVPHLLTVCGIQCLVLIPGRPPLCLRCNKVGHIRRQCRTPRCDSCRRFGHSADECALTYADKLRHGTRPPDEVVQEHLMDATEVLDATGGLSTEGATGSTTSHVAEGTSALPKQEVSGVTSTALQNHAPPQQDVSEAVQTVSSHRPQQDVVDASIVSSHAPQESCDVRSSAVSSLAPQESGDVSASAVPVLDLQGAGPQPSEHPTAGVPGSGAVAKRRAMCETKSGDTTEGSDSSLKGPRRKASKKMGGSRRSRSRSPGVTSREASPNSMQHT